jgi:glycosyltransferase involved in cell wall biosynthesis
MTLPKLFACMMIKDEEANLDRCLRSIVGLCDTIVAVDTGSTDKTVEIAQRYGAIVYPGAFNWRKPPIFDFSLHRNSGLQYCRELGADWCIVVDADEELQPIGITPDRFKARLARLPKHVGGLGCQVHERKDGVNVLSFWGTRLFRMKSGVLYDGRAHNRPKLPPGWYVGGSNVVIYHYGYSNPGVMKAKRARTLTLLKSMVKENPQDHMPFYYLCMTQLGAGDTEQGIASGEKCIEMLSSKMDDPKELGFVAALYYAIGWGYFHLWELKKEQLYSDRAYQWWMKGWESFPGDIDLNFELCFMGYAAYNADMVRNHGLRYLEAMEKYRQELDLPLDSFANNLQLGDLSIGARHIHHAVPEHETMVRAMMEKMEKEAA